MITKINMMIFICVFIIYLTTFTLDQIIRLYCPLLVRLIRNGLGTMKKGEVIF
jgi:hypothetical protein